MSEISEKAIELIKDLRRDISIDIMFTPEKNAEDDSLKQLVDYIAELEAEIAKMKKYFHKPAHGTCCTCQKCGHTYDECRCDFDEALDDLDKANARIAELERDFDMLFRSSANKQPRKNTQTETFVYGKDSKPIPCPFCGKLPYDDVLF